MAIDNESIRWATEDLVDPDTGNASKVSPTSSLRDSGLLAGEPMPRAYMNELLHAQYTAMQELQSQIDTLTISASSGIIETIYPVGAYYTTESTINPSVSLGLGTWVKVEGRTLIGHSDSDTDFDGLGGLGGSKSHSHTNDLTVDGHALDPSELPSHSHELLLQKQGNNKASEGETYSSLDEISDGDFNGIDTRTTETTGGDQPHSHTMSGDINTASSLPPYRVVNIWRRTA